MASETNYDILIKEKDGWADVTGNFNDGDIVSISNNDGQDILWIMTMTSKPTKERNGYVIKQHDTKIITISGKLWAMPNKGESWINISGTN